MVHSLMGLVTDRLQ